MNEGMKKRLEENLGHVIEIRTKSKGKIKGLLSWISPDCCMAEVKLRSGEINTVLDTQIKSIRKI